MARKQQQIEIIESEIYELTTGLSVIKRYENKDSKDLKKAIYARLEELDLKYNKLTK